MNPIDAVTPSMPLWAWIVFGVCTLALFVVVTYWVLRWRRESREMGDELAERGERPSGGNPPDGRVTKEGTSDE